MNAATILTQRFGNTKSVAMSLVRNASTSQKLAIAFALFLVPLGYVASKLAVEQQKNVDIAKIERQGGAYLRVVNEASAMLGMQMRADQLGRSDIDDVSPAIRTLRVAEQRYGASMHTGGISARAIASLETMQNNERARSTAAGAAAAALSDLAAQIGDQSHLLRDPERSSHFAAEVALNQAPALASIARDLAANAYTATADRHLSESERADLFRSVAVMQSTVDALNTSVEAILDSTDDKQLADALGPSTYNMLTNFASYRGAVEGMLAGRHIDGAQLIAHEAGAQYVLADLSSRVSDQLDRMLARRGHDLSNERTMTLLLAAMLFVGVLCSVVALLRVGLVAPLKSLSLTVRSIADGCYDADMPAINRGDEIGDVARALAVLRDAAQAKIAADAARAAAESANTAKSQFVAAMSHELRTPLNAIIGYAEILMEDAADRDDKTAETDLNRIGMAARHLLAVINDILDLSKIEAGRMDVLAAPCDPAELAMEAIATAEPLAAKNTNKLITDIVAVKEAFVDEQKLRQCLLNLLSNACKFTKDGQVSLSMALELNPEGDRLVFKVTDTGIGITPEQMAGLFRAFTQANSTITRQFGGTGLGLMITRRMAQLMGGDVSVESTPGVGTTFTLWVPQYYRGFGRKESNDVYAREGAEDAPLVVVIDDQADARDLVLRTLAPIGFAVQAARTAEAGLALVREQRPSLVLVDINLPDRAGWTLISDIVLDPEISKIPVVVLSIEEDRRRSLELGAAEHLVKPTSREKLCATALRLARQRPQAPDVVAAEIRRTA